MIVSTVCTIFWGSYDRKTQLCFMFNALFSLIENFALILLTVHGKYKCLNNNYFFNPIKASVIDKSVIQKTLLVPLLHNAVCNERCNI